MTRLICLTALLLTASVPSDLAAQNSTGAASVPDGWRVRPDAGSTRNGFMFTGMHPGWHVATGPSVILYDPSRIARDEFTVEAEIFLFNPGDSNEGFGIFVGGTDLDASAQRYTSFLIRRDGHFSIERRAGERTTTILDWSSHEAIVTWEGRGDAATARNVIGIAAAGDDVAFLVNGREVVRLLREELAADGVVGLRVHRSVSIHVTGLEITAPPTGAPATPGSSASVSPRAN